MDQHTYRCGEYRVDAGNRRFLRGEQELPLEPKVFAVLLRLLAQPGELCTREQLLDAVWGHRYVTPSTLNRIIGLVRRAFEDDVAAPRYIQTVHGAGYRFIGSLQVEGAGPEAARARFAPPPLARAPARLEPLIGREPELAQIGDLLAQGRTLTLLGSGGMGKTQTALEYVQRRAADYPDGVWFCDLVPMQRAEEWLAFLAVALSVRPLGMSETLERVSRALEGRRALLLLDNCDRIAPQVGAIVVELLRAAGRLQVLATSQAPLRFVGEQVLRLPPLGLPAAPQGLQWTRVAEAPAVQLLLRRVRAVQPAFELTRQNAAAVAEVCTRLDGMPLALELAAARFALLAPDQVLERLTQRFRFLVSEESGRDSRHRNLRALLEWGYGLLSGGEQQLLNWLGVFVQGWSMDAAIELGAALGRDPETMVEMLTGLVNKSLVQVDATASPPRYRLLESVREFALAQLQGTGAEARARAAHVRVVRRMVEGAQRDMLGGRMRERIATLQYEHGNIESAVEYASAARRDGDSALAIAGSLLLYCKAHGAYTEGIRICERALAAAPVSDEPVRGRALLTLGVAGVHGALPAGFADQALRDAARIAQQSGDRWALAYASGYHALWLINAGRAAEAAVPLTVAADLAQALEDPLLRGLAGLARGWQHLAAGDLERAIATLQAVQDVGPDFHQHHFIAMYIGLAHFQAGEHGRAAGQFLEALQRGVQVGNIRGVGGSIEGCAYLACAAGRLAEAARLLAVAERIRRRTQIPLFCFWRVHHQKAQETLRAALGPASHERATEEGERLREEDAANAAAALLREFAQRGGAAQEAANSPEGS